MKTSQYKKLKKGIIAFLTELEFQNIEHFVKNAGEEHWIELGKKTKAAIKEQIDLNR